VKPKAITAASNSLLNVFINPPLTFIFIKQLKHIRRINETP